MHSNLVKIKTYFVGRWTEEVSECLNPFLELLLRLWPLFDVIIRRYLDSRATLLIARTTTDRNIPVGHVLTWKMMFPDKNRTPMCWPTGIADRNSRQGYLYMDSRKCLCGGRQEIFSCRLLPCVTDRNIIWRHVVARQLKEFSRRVTYVGSTTRK